MTTPDWGATPGETPIDDASGLLVRGVTTRRQLNQVEAENIAVCASKYLVGRLDEAEAPFTFHWMMGLHAEMFGRVWMWAGEPRRCDLNIGSAWFDVEAHVLDLAKTIPFWAARPVMEQAARLHHRAVQIHPFLNGNGRWSRMLANIWLRRKGRRPTEWPEPAIGDTSPVRAEYIEAVKAADLMEYGPLVELHRKFTPDAAGEQATTA